jgi:hypothetical protein
LAENPLICPERIEFVPPVRIHHHDKHLVVYIYENNAILIIRLLHERMDIKNPSEWQFVVMNFKRNGICSQCRSVKNNDTVGAGHARDIRTAIYKFTLPIIAGMARSYNA